MMPEQSPPESIRASKKNISVRLYAALLVLAAMAPLAIFSAIRELAEIGRSEQDAFSQLKQSAEVTANNVKRWIKPSRELLEAVADRSQTKALTCETWISGFIDTSPYYSSYFLSLPSGEVICRYSRDSNRSEFAEVNAESDWFQNAVRADGFHVGDVQQERISRRWFVFMSIPVRSARGNVVAYAFLTSFVDKSIQSSIDTKNNPFVINVVDQNLHRITRWPDPEQWTGKKLVPRFPELWQQFDEGSYLSKTETGAGVTSLAVRVPVPGYNWAVYVSNPAGLAIEAAKQSAINASISLGGSIALITLCAYLAAGYISRPIQKVSAVTKSVVTGQLIPDFSALRAPAEIVDTVHALVGMSRAIADAEALQRKILDASPVASFVLAGVDKITAVNNTFTALFGYTLQDIPDLETWRRLAYPDATIREQISSEGDAVFGIKKDSLGTILHESRIIKARDGRDINTLVYANRISSDEQLFLISYVDITALISAESARKVAEARTELALSVSGSSTWDWDISTGEVRYTSPVATILGYAIGELSEDVTALSSMRHPDDQNSVQADFAQVLKGHKTDLVNEHRLKCKDGSFKWILVRGRVIGRDNQGQAQRMVGTLTDLTAYKDMEEQLRQSEKMAALGQLTGTVAHDVNNLLAIIMGSASLIQEEAMPGSRLEVFARRIIDTSYTGADLIRRMLLFSRKAKTEPVDLDLGTTVVELIVTLHATLGQRFEIAFEPAATGTIWIHIDRSMLEASLLNLCFNARDAMADGGTLSFTLATDRTEKIGVPKDWAVLSITDTGIGMTEDVLRRVFEPFFTTKQKSGGTGLGLAMVYNFVQQSSGTIEVKSSVGKGSTFILRFPQIPPGLVGQAEYADEVPKPGQGHKVLLVEDNELLRITLKDQLKAIGCRVLEASCVIQAKALIQRHADLTFVITDLDLGPGATGIELAEWINQEGYDHPGVIISGYLNLSTSRAAAIGWQELQKPLQIKQLSNLFSAIKLESTE
jgi:PAS domain S-box-containing protein